MVPHEPHFLSSLIKIVSISRLKHALVVIETESYNQTIEKKNKAKIILSN